MTVSALNGGEQHGLEMLKLCLINGVAFAKLLDLSQAGNGLVQVRYGSHCGNVLRPPESIRRGGFMDPGMNCFADAADDVGNTSDKADKQKKCYDDAAYLSFRSPKCCEAMR